MNQRIIVPVVPVRQSPSDTAEMITQYLYGEVVEVLEQKQQWRLCRSLRDQYKGWCDEKMLGAAEAADANTLLTLPVTRIKLPQQWVYLPAGSIVDGDDIPEQPALSSLEEAARQFLKAPYLWGGKSIFGIDCSGLTQIAAQLRGIALPRDAWQQAEMGEAVSFAATAEPGDLAFFDNYEGRVIHVGILTEVPDQEGLSIIHAAGEVRIDRFDHQGIYREDRKTYTHKLRVIKRLSDQ